MCTTAELKSKVTELKELKAMADELAGEIGAIEDFIKAEMNARNTEELQVDIFKIRYKTVKSRRFDSKAFKAVNGDLYDRFSKEVISKRFTIQ